MIAKIILFATLVGVGHSLDIIRCDGIPPPVKLVIANCPDKPPCKLYRGESGSGNVTFRVPFDTDAMSVEVKAKVFGGTVTFPMPDPDVCHFLVNGYCPLEEDERITYLLEVPVQKIYPKLKVELQVTMKGPKDENVACFKLSVQIADRPK